MNYINVPLPQQGDTLEVNIVNNPFHICNWSINELGDEVSRKQDEVSLLEVYGKGKEVSIQSNGISGVYRYHSGKGTLGAEADLLVSSGFILKKNSDLSISTAFVLNMYDLEKFLPTVGFMEYATVFETIQTTEDYPISNFLSIDGLFGATFPRGSSVSLSSPLSANYGLSETSIFSVESMRSNFISKTNSVSIIGMVSDSVDEVVTRDITLVDPVLTTGYIPLVGESAVSAFVACEELVSISGSKLTVGLLGELYPFENATIPFLKIDKSLLELSPSNLRYLNEVSELYVNESNPEFDSPVSETLGEFKPNQLVSVSEAVEIVDSTFDDLTSNTIDTIEEFKNYIKGVCVASSSDDYLGYDYTAPGGHIYLGYNFQNQDMILNEGSLLSLLFEERGRYSPSLPPVYHAALYFTDSGTVNQLAAYGQDIGVTFDIGTDTIGRVFQNIMTIAQKICAMTPDIVPNPEAPEFPEFSAEPIFIPVLLNPSFPIIRLSYNLSKPIYLPVFNSMQIVPPRVGLFNFQPQSTPYLSKPRYIPPVKSQGNFIPPGTFGGFTVSNYTDQLRKSNDTSSSKDIEYFTADSIYSPYLTFFHSEPDKILRCVMESKRHLNMMEVAVVATHLINDTLVGNYYFVDIERDYVISKSQFLMILLGDIFCMASGKTDLRSSIDMARLSRIIAGEEEDDPSNVGSRGACVSLGSSAMVETLSGETSTIIYEFNGITIDGEGTATGGPLLTKTELIGEGVSGSDTLGWECRVGSEKYISFVKTIAEAMIVKLNAYTEGRLYSIETPIKSEVTKIQSLDNIEEGSVLVDYLEGVVSEFGGGNKTVVADKYGILSSDNDVDTLLCDYTLKYSNIIVGSHGSVPAESRRRDIKEPVPGLDEVKLWRPLLSAYKTDIEEMEYLGLDSSTEAVFTIYRPFILVYKLGGLFKYDTVGINVIPTVIDHKGERYHALEAEGSTVVLGRVSTSGPASLRKYTQDYYDEWRSPLKLFGRISLSDNTISPIISVGGVRSSRAGVILNVETFMDANGGCDEEESIKESGISPSSSTNISDLTSLDPNAPTQEEGDVPGAYSFKLSMKATKYVPYESEGRIVNVVESTNIDMCITLGIIDGIVDEGGDVLAQGYSKDEIPTGEAIVYVSGHSLMDNFLSMERVTIGEFEASKFKFDLSSLIAEKLINKSTGKNFITYTDITTGQESNAVVKISSKDTENQEEDTPYKVVLVGNFRTPGALFSYKHAGQDPAYPIVTGYAGSSEVNFINGTRLVGTAPSPIPNTTYTNEDDASNAIENIDLTVNTVHFFINKTTLEIVIRDTKAVFSENRTIKIMTKATE